MKDKKGNPRDPGASYFVRGGELKGREHHRISGNTIFRRVNPANPALANCNPNMAIDFSEQRPIMPSKFHAARSDKQDLRTMNRSGKPAEALGGIVIGAGQDDKGRF